MQNKKNFNSFKGLLQKRGYYIVALICALAVGVSGYLYVTQRDTGGEQLSSGSVPQIVEEPRNEDSTPPAQRNASPSVDAAAVQPDVQEEQAEPKEEPAAFTMIMPVEGDLLQLYAMEHLSYNPTTRDWRTHDGIDICSGVGAEVRAAADGTVASIYEDEALGTVVTISHADGYLTRYCNLEPNPIVSVGQQVSQGDAIGAVGTSALMETGIEDHLHFELCCDAISLNPTDYFAW